MIDKSLVEKMRINEIEITDRLNLLNLSADELELLSEYKSFVEGQIEGIVEEFYHRQTSFAEIAMVIGDMETMRRLRNALRRYIIELFAGYYDTEYVNSRLRIGLVHKRIGVEPKLFIAGSHSIKVILTRLFNEHIQEKDKLNQVLQAIDKLLHFDMSLVFETYIETMVEEVENAKRRLESYATALEEKSRLLEMHAERDPLTDLFNKRSMQKVIKREIRMAQRRHTILSLIYIDVDRFKYINDTYGHARGDEILIAVARCIAESIRVSDFPFRIGGDEFCVILPDCDNPSASTIAGNIVAALEKVHPDVTLSIGISETGTQDYLNEEQLLHEADRRMYEHKGRLAEPH